MGNHDYGDYVPWKTPEDRARNIARLHYLQNEMGWKMLIDANTKLQRKGDSIALIGVENWGKGFKEYGNLTKAAAGSESAAFKILMSHDPTHWEQIVKDFPHKIDLTLSGHTHGMQFGIEAGDFRWSPVSFRYPHWAGLYHEQDLYLHVNRGFGYIGFPGRVGIYPEITIITLRKGEKHV
jgi:predicted MPP superfamily phosphohydrolase